MAGAAACLAAAAAIGVTVPTVTRAHAGPPATGTAGSTVYVASLPRPPARTGWVTPIRAATGEPGPRIKVGPWTDMMAVTPDGKTIYVVDQVSDEVIPISTATRAAGRPIKVAHLPFAIVITPDSRTAFVLSEKSQLTPISTATGRAGKPIAIRPVPAQTGLSATPAITHDGKTIFVSPASLSNALVPVDIATRRAEKPIMLGVRPQDIVIAPDGKTTYLVNPVPGTVTPMATATGKLGRPIRVGSGPVSLAITADGKTAYAVNRDSAP